MKRATLLVLALLLTACAAPIPAVPTGTEPPADAANTPAAAGYAVQTEAPTELPVFVQAWTPAPTDAPRTPIPTPTPSPTATPVPTATPEPTPTPSPTPNPYRAEKVTTYKKNSDFWYCKLTEATQERIIGTTFPVDPKDCPIKITDLRYVSLLYVDFDGVEHTGEIIVHKSVADDVLDIFYHLYKAKYPLTSVKLLDDYNEPFSDGTSMVENNTSGFCCRLVTGTNHFSKHSYGVAIDVNPALNPYIRPDGSFAPLNSEPYLDRSLKLPGMIDEKDLCYKLFTKHGWKWGGHFKGETDYQHFYKKIP